MWWSTQKAPRGPAADSSPCRTVRSPERFRVVGNLLRQGHAECEAALLALPALQARSEGPISIFQIGRTPRYCVDLSQPDTHLVNISSIY